MTHVWIVSARKLREHVSEQRVVSLHTRIQGKVFLRRKSRPHENICVGKTPRNEGGGAGMGMGLGAGIGFGQMMAGSMGSGAGGEQQKGGQGAPSAEDPAETLRKLKGLFESQLISAEEYDAKKKEILDRM